MFISKGVFWALIILIVILVIYILIRDRALRDVIGRFFAWIRKKIRLAKMKGELNRERLNKEEWVKKLGETVWEKEIKDPSIADHMGEISDLKGEETLSKERLDALNADIEKHRQDFEEFKKAQESRVQEAVKEKDPLEEDLKNLEKQLHALDKEVKECEKQKIKANKGIEHNRKERELSEEDVTLSNIEKQQRREETEARIQSFEKEIEGGDEKLQGLSTEKSGLQDKIKVIQSKVDNLTSQIKKLEEDLKSREDQTDDAVKKLEDNKRALNVKIVGVQKQLNLLFMKVGEKVNQDRPDNELLSDIYSRIDALDSKIRKLETQLQAETPE